MPRESNENYRFGDLLALARLSWVRQMGNQLADLGYDDYRRSDAAVMRLLQRGPTSINRLGEATGVTRQAARKMADGLERRGFAVISRDESDLRQINVELTEAGTRYARAVVEVIDRLNEELRERVEPADLAGAADVLRVVVESSRQQRPGMGKFTDMTDPTQSPTNISNIGVAMFTIADQDAAIAFYTQTLGWELRSDVAFDGSGNRWVEVAPAGSATRLALNPPMGDWQPGGSSIGVETPDVNAEYARVSAIDGVTTTEPMGGEGPVPRMFSISDPDGNNIWVVQPAS